MTDRYYGSVIKPSLWYFLTFPIDAWREHEDLAFVGVKQDELYPLMRFLIPLIVLVAAFTCQLGFWSGLLFFGIESLVLSLLSIPYVKLHSASAILNIFFNFWLSFILVSLCMTIAMLVLGIFF